LPEVSRTFSDVLLFSVTIVELLILILLARTLSLVDGIYTLQHGIVLGIALTRSVPLMQDRSLLTGLAIVASYAYPYTQVVYLGFLPGGPTLPVFGLILVVLSALLSLASLLFLGTMFGIRPAVRGLATNGPYRFVRHPMYLAYVLGDIGYNLQESNSATVLMMIIGWTSLLYRIGAEERIMRGNAHWPSYAQVTRYRLIPGFW
jgi:protein-S-isoprenylcysteine O-methyltransferase Ste14